MYYNSALISEDLSKYEEWYFFLGFYLGEYFFSHFTHEKKDNKINFSDIKIWE